MRGFSEPSVDPRIQAIEASTPNVLEQYGLAGYPWSPLSHGENTTIRVCAPNSENDSEPLFVLRFHAPDRSDVPRVLTELTWLESLQREGFAVPEPMRTPSGDAVLPVTGDTTTNSRVATLLRWVPGKAENDRRSTNMLFLVGQFMGRLHEHARRFRLSSECRPNRWDYEGLFGETSPMAAGWKMLDAPRLELFKTVTEHFRKITSELGESSEEFGLIHADLHFGNVLIAGSEVRAIDFDDCGLGYWLYDLAVTLETLEERPDYLWLRSALIDGYRQVRPLSAAREQLLDAFIAARRVLLVLWLLCRLDHPSLKRLFVPYIRVALPRLAKFAEGQPRSSP